MVADELDHPALARRAALLASSGCISLLKFGSSWSNHSAFRSFRQTGLIASIWTRSFSSVSWSSGVSGSRSYSCSGSGKNCADRLEELRPQRPVGGIDDQRFALGVLARPFPLGLVELGLDGRAAAC